MASEGGFDVSSPEFLVLFFILIVGGPLVMLLIGSVLADWRCDLRVEQFPWKLLLLACVVMGMLGFYSVAVALISEAPSTKNFMADDAAGSEAPDPDAVAKARSLVAELEREAAAEQKADAKRIDDLAAPKRALAKRLGHPSLEVTWNKYQSQWRTMPMDPLCVRGFNRELSTLAVGHVKSPEKTETNQLALKCHDLLTTFDSSENALALLTRWHYKLTEQNVGKWRTQRARVFWREELQALQGVPYRSIPDASPVTKDGYTITAEVLRDLQKVYRPFAAIPDSASDRQLAQALKRKGTFAGTVFAPKDNPYGRYQVKFAVTEQEGSTFSGWMEFKAPRPQGPQGRNNRAIDGSLYLTGVVNDGVLYWRTTNFKKRDRGLWVGAVYRGYYKEQEVTGRWKFPIIGLSAGFQLR